MLARRTLTALALASAAGGSGWVALGGASGATPDHVAAAVAATPATPARTPRPAVPAQPPLPKAHPRVVEPVAGQATGPRRAHSPAVREADTRDAAPTRPASFTRAGPRAAAGVTDGVRDATALPNGIALPPLEAPQAVMTIIQAGNSIARSPYKWGGGHGRWIDTGYDCSGSVSYALAAAGLVGGPLDSSRLMRWGRPGRGKWITVYASPGHVYMQVAGLRFDTSGARVTGSRWQNDLRSGAGFVARHPTGSVARPAGALGSAPHGRAGARSRYSRQTPSSS